MMPCDYKALNGTTMKLDLDAVYDVALGYSARQKGWTATLVFDPATSSFVELRSSPPDYRGNSVEEAEEVTDQYVCEHFSLEAGQLISIRNNPSAWKLVSRR